MLDSSGHIDLASEDALATVPPGALFDGLEGASAPELTLRMTRHKQTCPRARTAIRDWSHGLCLPEEVDQTLLLLVSELVSNAVEHSTAGEDEPIAITASLEGGLLRVSVTDAGDGFQPSVRQPIGYQRGYGLFLVDQTSNRWGVEQDRGTCVWFELELSQAGELRPALA